MQFYTQKKRPLTINIVSLIDILTILLFFFIITTTFKKNEPQVEIKLPESATAKKSQKPQEPVIIRATKDKKIWIESQEVPLEQLAVALKQKKSQMPQAHFALEADKDVPLGFFVRVLDASREADLGNLALRTAELKPPQPATP